MAPRANWKGNLRVSELTCAVALYTAVSASERIGLHIINRRTGNPVHRQYLDSETGRFVKRDDQIKGYEDASGATVTLEPDEIAAAIPDSDKILNVSTFVKCDAIDPVYFDKPYYLTPIDHVASEAYALIREGMRVQKVAAIARTVLFRRVRTLIIRPHGVGLIATTLNFDYEVRSARDAFAEIPSHKISKEMLDLAEHIIKSKKGVFDPSRFEDRYEASLAELVKAKLEGRNLPARSARQPEKIVDLMQALRASTRSKSGKSKKSDAPRRRQSGDAPKPPLSHRRAS